MPLLAVCASQALSWAQQLLRYIICRVLCRQLLGGKRGVRRTCSAAAEQQHPGLLPPSAAPARMYQPLACRALSSLLPIFFSISL